MALKVKDNEFQITGSTPKVRLTGSEAGGRDISLRENSGVIETYDENTGKAMGLTMDVTGVNSYAYTWDRDVRVEAGRCLSVTLPPGKEVEIPDGYNLDIEDGGDLILFSL